MERLTPSSRQVKFWIRGFRCDPDSLRDRLPSENVEITKSGDKIGRGMVASKENLIVASYPFSATENWDQAILRLIESFGEFDRLKKLLDNADPESCLMNSGDGLLNPNSGPKATSQPTARLAIAKPKRGNDWQSRTMLTPTVADMRSLPVSVDQDRSLLIAFRSCHSPYVIYVGTRPRWFSRVWCQRPLGPQHGSSPQPPPK